MTREAVAREAVSREAVSREAGNGAAAGDWLAINTIRTLTIDAVQAAQSGHPGAAMALAPVGYTLWNDALRYDVHDPAWLNRDRFVLSAGHASMLLYSLLHLAQVRRCAGDPALAVPLPDIRRFRQLGSVCAGHPEHGLTPGVECTTGPLSTGAGASVGMAMAGRWLAEHFNRPGFGLFDYMVYAVVGDGCLMEGLGQEAASLAGHLRLGNLCWIYDSNRVTIEGPTDLAFSEDVQARFRAYGWQVRHVADVADLATLRAGYAAARASARQPAGPPTLLVVDTVIGIGAPTKQGTAAAHSEPLGIEEARAAKRSYGWPEDASFLVPDEAYRAVRRWCRGARAAGPVGVGPDAGPLPGGPAGSRGRTRPDDDRGAAAGVGQRAARVLARRPAIGRARREPAGAEHDRAAGALAARRGERSRSFGQVPAHLPGRRGLSGGQLRRAESALRRAGGGRRGGGQRHGAVRGPPVPGRFPGLLRLPARPTPALRADAAAGGARVHARLDLDG